MLIEPIDNQQQLRIIDEVERYLSLAGIIHNVTFASIDVRFDLKGKAAGMYRVKQVGHNSYQRVLRFNPWLFAKYPEDSWQNTVPHEVAHYIVDCLYGFANVRPHGQEWRVVMECLGAQPLVTANYDLEGIPIKQMKRYAYRCGCREVLVSSQRHRKIQASDAIYRCRDCGHILKESPLD